MSTSSITKILPWILLIGGTLGFIASFVLTVDKIHILQNPSYSPPCNINPIISCGSVMKTEQASVFGFANSLIGIAAYAVLAFFGVCLIGGAKFPSWMWRGLQAGLAFGLGFVCFLIFQSLYRIHSLCPYCMVVWIVTIASFWYALLYNLQQGYIPKVNQKIIRFFAAHHADILLVFYLVIVGLILHKFWYYFNPFH